MGFKSIEKLTVNKHIFVNLYSLEIQKIRTGSASDESVKKSSVLEN